MAGDLAQLGIQVDSSQAKAASGDLDKLASSAQGAQKATDSLAATNKSATSATAQLGSATSATAQITNDMLKATGLMNGTLQGTIAATKAVQAAQAAGAAAIQATGVAAAESAAVQVAAGDAVVANSVAVRETLVLLREAARGNYSRMAGSASILTQSLGLLTVSNIVLGAAILVPLAALGLFEVAVAKSAAANEAFENTLAGIGRTGSASLADVDKAAQQASSSIGISVSSAKSWAETYATVGKVGGDVLTGLTSITKEYADATGKDTTEAVKALADAFADPAKGAETLNSQLGFLNATELTHIKQLADEGDRLGAQKALYADLNKALDETAQVHVTGLIKAWQDVATWAGNAWEAMKVAAGGGDLLQKQAVALKNLQDAQARASGSGDPFSQTSAIEKATADYAAATKAVDAFNATVAKGQLQTNANKQTTNVQPLLDSIFPDDAAIQKLKTDYAALANAADAAAKAGRAPDPKVAAGMKVAEDAIDRVTDAYKQYGGSAGVAHQIAVLQAQAASTTDQATKGQIATQIHLLQTLGELTPAQQRLTAAQDAGAIVADKVHKTTDGVVTSYNKNLQALQDQTAAQNALNAQVASGSITVQQAIAQEKLDKELKSQIASIETDTKLTLAQKLDMIQKLTKAQKDYNASQDVGDFQKITDEMQTQVKLAGMSSDERDRENAVLSAQHQINGTLSIDDANKVRALVDQQKAAEQLGRVADGVQSSFQDFFTTVFSGGKDAFHNLVDSIKNQFAQLLAWMVVQAIAQPIIVPVIGAITGGAIGAADALGAGGLGGAGGIGNIFGSLGSIGSAGGSLAGSSGFLGGIGSQISSAASWLTSGINNIGASLGFSAGTSFGGISTVGVTPSVLGTGGFAAPNIAGSSSLLGGTTLTGLLGGAGLGLGVGSMLSSLTGGNSTGGSIGGALGGAIGSVVPVIGTLVGSIAGGLIGGLFGPGKTAGKASATFDANGVITGYGGDKATDKSTQAVQSAAQTISSVVQTLSSAGVDISNSISKLVIADNRDKSFILTASGQKQTVGTVGDPNSAIQGTLDYLLKGASSSDANISQVLKHYQATGGITSSNASQVASDIAFAKSLENISFDTTKQLSQAATALKTLNDNYQTAIDRAKSLGLSTDSLTKAQAHDVALLQKSTSDAYVAQFQSVSQGLKPLDNYQSAIKSINDALTQATSDLTDLGGSIIDVTNAANQAKAALATAFNTDIKTQLLGIVNSAAASYTQLAASEAQRVADAKAVGGDLALVNQLNDAEMQKFIVGLSASDRALLVSAGILTSAQSAAANAISTVSDGIDSLINRATAAGQAAQQASQAWSAAQQSLDQSRKALLVSGPGVSPQNAYLAAQSQYSDLLQKAQTDPAQAQAFASFASQFLQTSLAYNATGGGYGSDFSKVQTDLASLSSLAGTQATAQDKLASLSQSSLDTLNAMKAQLASGQPNITLLQQQLAAQNNIVTAIEAGNVLAAQAALVSASTFASMVSANDNALITAILAKSTTVTPVAVPVATPTQTAPTPTSAPASNSTTTTPNAATYNSALLTQIRDGIAELKQAQTAQTAALKQGNLLAVTKLK